ACFALLCLAAAGTTFAIGNSNREKPPTTAQVMESATPADWRQPDPANTLYMELPGGRVIIELAPRFAPQHVANIKKLVAEKFFDGLAVARVQDNFVAQWGDADKARPTETALRKLPDENAAAFGKGAGFIQLPDPDGYARETGWLDGFPVGVERKPSGQVWIAHCYGVLGVGRDDWPDTGSGAELYVVIGQAPRQLDRNVVTLGRVSRGIELLSSLPRGTGALGFYEKPEQRAPIKSIRLASDVPEAERTALEVLRTDTPLFAKYVESRRNRRDNWYVMPAGHVDVCNVTIPVREVPKK
ncbi:MAG: peptidylprolyl isomerase, partial [Peristeroidobacter soli]